MQTTTNTPAQSTQPQAAYRPRRILRRPEVEDRVGLKKSALYALIREGKFPQSVKLGAKSVGWKESDVDDWIDGRG